MADRLSMVLELPHGTDHGPVRSWLVQWLREWLATVPETRKQQDASFVYVLLRRVPVVGDPMGVGSDGPVCEFLTLRGVPFTAKRLANLVRPYLDAAGITKPGACHLFRHTAAALMLEGGADIRYVQELLGHASIDTTTIYTQVSAQRLKAVHAACHPGASNTPRRHASVDTSGDDEIAAHLDAWLAAELDEELDRQPDHDDHDGR